MFSVFISSKEKSITKVLLKKTKPNCWEQILFSVPFSVNFWLDDEFRQLSIRNRCLQLITISSEGDRPLISTGLLFLIRSLRLKMSLWSERCFFVVSWQSQHLLVKKNKKNEKNMELEIVPDHTQMRLNTFMIRPKCAQRGYDQIQLRSKSPLIRLFRPKLPLIRPSPDHRPDCSALELLSRHCNFGLGTHWCALDWVWS